MLNMLFQEASGLSDNPTVTVLGTDSTLYTDCRATVKFRIECVSHDRGLHFFTYT